MGSQRRLINEFQSAVGLGMVWSYAALIVGALMVGFGVRHRFKRNRRGGRIEVGRLSDSWLAEQRAQRDDGH